MSKVTIYHNPRCSKSRQTLAILEEQGIKPDVVLYLETPPDARELKLLVDQLGISPRELLRTSETEYKAMKLDNKKMSDADVINAMVKAPILIQRPIVVKGNKAVMGRPPENVLSLL